MLWGQASGKRIIHKWIHYSFTLKHSLPRSTPSAWCVERRRGSPCFLRWWYGEVHVNIYIGFRKQLLLRKNLFLFTQIQNKETLLRLPVIDMWACFSSHWLEQVSICDLFLTGLKLLVVWHISEQLLDTEVFKVMGTVCLRDGEVSKTLAQNNFLFD